MNLKICDDDIVLSKINFDDIGISMLLPKYWKVVDQTSKQGINYYNYRPNVVYASDNDREVFTLSILDNNSEKNLEEELLKQHYIFSRSIAGYQNIGIYQKTINEFKVGCIIYKSYAITNDLFTVFFLFQIGQKMCIGNFVSKYEDYKKMNDIAVICLESIQLM